MYRPQFSLSYLFAEVFWIAAALGCATQAFRLPRATDVDLLQALLLCISGLFAGAAVGGLFGRMIIGFLAAFGIIVAGLVGAMVLAVAL